jgi:hypothetical protein
LFFFPKNPNEETAELAGLGTRTYRCRGEHQRSAELHGRLQLPERKEKQQWSDSRSKRRRKRVGKKKRKKHGENKNGSCRSSTSFFCPQQRFSESGKRYKEKTCRGRMRGTTMAQKLPRGAQDFVGDDGTRTTAATTFARSRVRSRGSHSYVMLQTFFKKIKSLYKFILKINFIEIKSFI